MFRVLLCVLLFVWALPQGLYSSQQQSESYVKQQLRQIPLDDQNTLTLYFETLLAQNFAYTLFGDKPVSGDGYCALEGDRSWKEAILKAGKKVWQKYCHLFPAEKFVLQFQPRDTFEDVFLINKKAFLDTARQHSVEFQKVLGRDITPEKLLEEFTKNNTRFEELLQNHEGLIGLLYGFGKANAFLCYRLQVLDASIDTWLNPPFSFLNEKLTDDELEEICQDPFGYFRNASTDPQNRFLACIPAELKTLFSEYGFYRSMMHGFPNDEDGLCLSTLFLFPLPSFGANFDHPETAVLKENYIKTRLNIIHAYSQGDFLEVTLCKLLEK